MATSERGFGLWAADGLDDTVAHQHPAVGKTTCCRRREGALARRTAQAVDDYRANTLHDLDLLESKMWRAATAGDLRAITQTLRVMDQRARLLRLFDKPERQALDAPTEEPVVGRRPKRPVPLVGPIVVT